MKTPRHATPPARPPSRAARAQVLRATLEYDGGRYRGWQAQVNARTVQGALLAAVEDRLGPGVRIYGAGRTDAGVHALAQVASLHLPPGRQARDLGALRADLNDRLPADIHILSLVPAPAGFHARHDALLRIYRYRVSRRRTAFGKPYVWWVKEPLEVAAMSRAAELLVGRQDFFSFCENPEGHDSTIVEVSYAHLTHAPEAPDLLVFRIGASHYLWKMVRRLIGTLVALGAGRLSAAEFEELLRTRSARPAAFTAPASGLFLEAVVYPGDPAPPDVSPLRPAF